MRCLVLTAVLNALVILSFIVVFTVCWLYSRPDTTRYIRILDVFFCVITATALFVTGKSVSTAILSTLHRQTPLRVRAS